MAIHKFKSGGDKWLEFRGSYIMATEVSPMFGLNPYTSIAEIYRKKKTLDKVDNVHLRAGRIYEPAVINALKGDLGWDIGYLDGTGEHSFIFTNKNSPLAATPDAFRWDISAVVELKTVSPDKGSFNKYWRAGSPPHWYLIQNLVQIASTNSDLGFLVCLEIGSKAPIAVYEVQPRPDLIARAEELARAFNEKDKNGDSIRSSVRDKEFALRELKDCYKLVHITEAETSFFDSINIEEMFSKGGSDGGCGSK